MMGRLGQPLLRPDAGYDPASFYAERLNRVDPGELAGGVYRHRDKHALLEALTAWSEALEVVDGWRTSFEVVVYRRVD